LGDLRETIAQFFSEDILINYKFDEWIKNLENSGNLNETKQQFLDNDKYGKESSDYHKYFQKDSNSLLIPLP
ncbi:549_t:CDS:1, partial [Gigaspora margarita]